MSQQNSVLSAQAEPEWKNYDDFARGIDTNRLPATHDWVGREMALTFEEGHSLSLQFSRGETTRLQWQWDQWQGSGTYEEVRTSQDRYFLDIQFDDRPEESLTLIINASTRRALAVHCILLPDGQYEKGSRLKQVFWVGHLDGGEVTGLKPAPTRELIGYRTLNVYSPNHYYEHIYINSERYAWQNLKGEQFGHGDMDYATCYKFEEDMYVFTFREKVIPVCSVFFFDYVLGRCTGKFLGVTSEGRPMVSPAGAYIYKMSYNCYPTGVAPM